jgi:hypothetical protein
MVRFLNKDNLSDNIFSTLEIEDHISAKMKKRNIPINV